MMEFIESNTFQPLVAALDSPRSFEDYVKGLNDSWNYCYCYNASKGCVWDNWLCGSWKAKVDEIQPEAQLHIQHGDSIVLTHRIWIELLYTCKCHYDSITSLDGWPLSRPIIPSMYSFDSYVHSLVPPEHIKHVTVAYTYGILSPEWLAGSCTGKMLVLWLTVVCPVGVYAWTYNCSIPCVHHLATP